jgi:hypothetical protein
MGATEMVETLIRSHEQGDHVIVEVVPGPDMAALIVQTSLEKADVDAVVKAALSVLERKGLVLTWRFEKEGKLSISILADRLDHLLLMHDKTGGP